MECSKASTREGTLGFSWVRLRNQIARMTRRDDADDLLQDAWLSVAARRTQADNAEALLARIAANRGIDAYRRERRVGSMIVAETTSDSVADSFPLQDEVMIARERLDHVRGGVAQLSPRSRQIFLMYRLDGRKYREIAEELGISQSAVEKHIAKAMAHLAEWMEHW